MVLREEIRSNWRVLLGTILVYLMCYPGTVLLVVPGLTSVAGRKDEDCLRNSGLNKEFSGVIF